MLPRTFSAKKTKLRRDELGRPLCRFCSSVVLPPRRTFCSKECVHEWSVRSSSSYARRHVKKRDKGVCAGCGANTEAIRLNLKKILRECRVAGDLSQFHELTAQLEIKDAVYKAFRAHSLWEADHIVPVSLGGGCCGLENLRTLCWKCHRKETALLRQQRNANRAQVKPPGP